MARLVIVSGKREGSAIELGKVTVAIGRLASCELSIEEPQASRRHFEVERREGATWVKDLGSKNGTYLNEARLEGEAKLEDGDRLRVGATVIAFEAGPKPFPIGTKLANYELGLVLERREGLTVHEASHGSLKRNVLVEVLEPEASLAKSFLARARAASAYDHPALLAVFDAGEHEGRAYRVREFVKGGRDLEARLREGRLPPAFALGVAQQVANGLAHIHAQGGAHGWLTPKVIDVDETGTVKVEIVGGDKRLRLDPERKDARLQALSISPEEARGLDASAKGDVYALGCVLYRSLAGAPPFDGELVAIIRGHAGDTKPKALEAIDPALEGGVSDLVASMLQKKPDSRPDMVDVAEKLAELAPRASTVATPPVPPKSKGGKWGKSGVQAAPSPPSKKESRRAEPPKKKEEPREEKRSEPKPKPSAKKSDDETDTGDELSIAARKAVEAAESEDPDTDEPELVRWRSFDPTRSALLGVVFFLLFFLASEGTRIVLKILAR